MHTSLSRFAIATYLLTPWACIVAIGPDAQGMRNRPSPCGTEKKVPQPGTIPAVVLERAYPVSGSRDDHRFTENRGQWPADTRFVAVGEGLMLSVETSALCLMPRRSSDGRPARDNIRMVFENSSTTAWVEGIDAGPTLYHYYLGSDPSQWVTNVLGYRAVLIHDLYPGISLRASGTASSGFKYDLLLDPGADPSMVVVHCEGASGLRIGQGGDLILSTGAGTLVQPSPPTWVEGQDGARSQRLCCFRMVRQDAFGFELDPTSALDGRTIIDPGIVWASYLGCNADGTGDTAFGVASEPNGQVTAVGRSGYDFQGTPGAFASGSNSMNAFVTKFASDGSTAIYSAVIGGSSSFDYPMAVDVDGLGEACVVGFSFSTDFPTTAGSFQPTYSSGGAAAFALKLSPMGDHLVYSTFLSHCTGTFPFNVRSTASGATVIVGATDRHGFPTTPGVIEPTISGTGAGFVMRLDPLGSHLEWSTFFGDGAGSVNVFGLDIDANDDVLIGGETYDSALPGVAGAFQPTCDSCTGGYTDAFVSRLRADAQAVLWTTYLGGHYHDKAFSVSIAPDGGAVVVGTAASLDFPTTPNAIQPSYLSGDPTGVPNGFIARVGPGGTTLEYSTYLGWQGEAVLKGRVDQSGIITVAGKIGSEYPTTPGSISNIDQAEDFSVLRLDPSGERVLYSTFLGGPGVDWPSSLDLLPSGRVVGAGSSTGSFPTTPGTYQPQYAGGQFDAVIAVLDLQPTGVRPFGEGMRACKGQLYQLVSAMPVAGSQRFGAICSQAPPNADGVLIVGSAALGSPQTLFGAQIWIDLTQPFTRFPVHADAHGYAEVPMHIPPGTQGHRFYTQFLFRVPSTCAAASQRVSSNALEITVQ